MLPEHFGDGLLMRNGVTLVWVGWEFDVPGIKVKAPTAMRNGAPLVETIADPGRRRRARDRGELQRCAVVSAGRSER